EAWQRPHPKRLGHRRSNQPLLGERREIDPPDPVSESAGHLGCGLQAQPRLATTSRTGKRQQPRRRTRLARLSLLSLPAEQPRQRGRQVRRDRDGVSDLKPPWVISTVRFLPANAGHCPYQRIALEMLKCARFWVGSVGPPDESWALRPYLKVG